MASKSRICGRWHRSPESVGGWHRSPESVAGGQVASISRICTIEPWLGRLRCSSVANHPSIEVRSGLRQPTPPPRATAGRLGGQQCRPRKSTKHHRSPPGRFHRHRRQCSSSTPTPRRTPKAATITTKPAPQGLGGRRNNFLNHRYDNRTERRADGHAAPAARRWSTLERRLITC